MGKVKMSKYRNLLLCVAAASVVAGPALAGKFGLGRPALPEEIAAWDLDIAPDGTGLPAGSGSVLDGEETFAEFCASCHGDFAEGVDNWPKLAGGADTLADKDPLKTVGSYWPYLSTSFDYIRRSMPFGNAQSLTDDQVYEITAYILYSNDLVDEDFVLSNENFMEVELPNAQGFILDDRDTTEAHFWTEPCMENCKDVVEITMRAAVLDVTPEDETAKAEAPAVVEAAATPAPAPEPEPAPEPVAEVAALDEALVKKGAKVFKKCKACHQVGGKAKNKTGPILNGIIGAPIGQVEGFKYSKAMKALGEEGQVWDDENLTAFLTKPKKFLKKTKMSFAGLKKEADIAAVTEYLKSVGN
jgi:cytochrome c